MIKGKSQEEIRKQFKITSDFTPEEEEQARPARRTQIRDPRRVPDPSFRKALEAKVQPAAQEDVSEGVVTTLGVKSALHLKRVEAELAQVPRPRRGVVLLLLLRIENRG